MKQVSIKSYAKINISLAIKGKREDGYHELDSIMVPIELHDSIIISELPGKTDDNFVTVDDFSSGLIHYNLVSACINALTKKYKRKEHFRVYIHKNIPMQAGLGGGSSNAAFAMKAINNLLKLGATDEEIVEIATPLGADIPFFVRAIPSRCQGIGEKITPIEIKNNYNVLIIKPKEGVSTKEAFKIVDHSSYKDVDIDKVLEGLREGDDDKVAEYMGNSLEDAAMQLVPEIKEIKDYLYSKGLKLVLMSGSGSTVFALSTDRNILKKIVNEVEDKWFVELTRIIK